MGAALILDPSGSVASPLRDSMPELDLQIVKNASDACERLNSGSVEFDIVVAQLPEGHRVAQVARRRDVNLGVVLLSAHRDAQASQRELMFLTGITTHVVSLPQQRLDLVVREVVQMVRATRQRRRHRGLLNRTNALLPPPSPSANSREALQKALHESEARQRKLITELESALKLRDRFLTIAAHELRTPITALRLNIETARRLVNGGPAASKLEAISRQERRLMDLVEVLLDVSRLQMGRRQLHFERLDLRAVVKETLERFELERERSRSTVALEADAPLWGSWDRLGIDTILSNLVSNALKYGRGAPIMVRVSEAGGQAVVRVVDQGIGIAPEDVGKLFAPFVRAVNERNYGGFGVGLWIARSMAELHGGSLSVTSGAGRGTEFLLTLPRAPDGMVRPSRAGPELEKPEGQ